MRNTSYCQLQTSGLGTKCRAIRRENRVHSAMVFDYSAKMSERNPVGVRRKPKQSRSILTIERVLTSAAAVLDRDGFDGFSMQSVADEADLAIGTLYQYFPNKYSLLKTLIERWYEKEDAFDDFANSSMPDIDSRADVYLNELGGPALLEAIYAVAEFRQYDRMKMDAGVHRIAAKISGGGNPGQKDIARARVTLYAIDGVLRAAIRLPPNEAKRTIAVLKEWIALLYSSGSK